MYVPRLGAFATTPVGPDAAVVMSAHVCGRTRGKGIGRQLVQSAAGLVARRDIRALEAVGTYHDGPSCMLPVGWLEAVGFEVVRPHPITPRLRMDLQNAVRWRPGLGAAWNRLTGLVRQPQSPEPATYTHREAELSSIQLSCDSNSMPDNSGTRGEPLAPRRCRAPGSACPRSASRRGRTP